MATIFTTHATLLGRYLCAGDADFYNILKFKQLELNQDNKYFGISLYIYEYVNGQLSTDFNKFSSINELSKSLGLARKTIKRIFKYICTLQVIFNL